MQYCLLTTITQNLQNDNVGGQYFFKRKWVCWLAFCDCVSNRRYTLGAYSVNTVECLQKFWNEILHAFVAVHHSELDRLSSLRKMWTFVEGFKRTWIGRICLTGTVFLKSTRSTWRLAVYQKFVDVPLQKQLNNATLWHPENHAHAGSNRCLKISGYRPILSQCIFCPNLNLKTERGT